MILTKYSPPLSRSAVSVINGALGKTHICDLTFAWILSLDMALNDDILWSSERRGVVGVAPETLFLSHEHEDSIKAGYCKTYASDSSGITSDSFYLVLCQSWT